MFLLPLVAVICAAGWCCETFAPRELRAEHRRVLGRYRETAAQLVANPELGENGPRGKGWRQRGKIADISWGVLEEEAADEVTVWVAEKVRGRTVRTLKVPAIEERPLDFYVYFAVAGAVALITFLWLGLGWTIHRERKMREDFLAAAAHDLKTPLIGLQDAVHYDPEYALKLVDRLLRMVGNINDFLKLGGRRPAPKPADFHLAAVVHEAYRLFAEEFEDARGTAGGVPIEVPADLVVHADPTFTLQIIWNILGNDLKYAAPFGRVSIRTEIMNPELVQLVIADEGPGMSARARRNCFRRYYRARTIRESGKGGFGIGLCTARELARAMGGDLTVSPNQPQGCVFALTLRTESSLMQS